MTEVRYAQEFKKNLILLGTLDFKGFKITMEGEALKVIVGAQVMMRGNNKNNMYFLQGSTVVDGATTNCEKLQEVDIDCTRL